MKNSSDTSCDRTSNLPTCSTALCHCGPYRIKVKGKVHPRTGPEGMKRYSSTLSLTSALYGVSGQRHGPAALLPARNLSTHRIGHWVGPNAGLDGYGKSRPPPGFDPQTVQPVASRYTD